jgi:hypothetical protein
MSALCHIPEVPSWPGAAPPLLWLTQKATLGGPGPFLASLHCSACIFLPGPSATPCGAFKCIPRGPGSHCLPQLGILGVSPK